MKTLFHRGIAGRMPATREKQFPINSSFFAACFRGNFSPPFLTECGRTLVTNSNLISKAHVPRLVVPASSVIVSTVDFMICAKFLVTLLVRYQFVASANVVFVLDAFAASLGVGLWTEL
jgi:lipopolysaccharide transport system permease protein